MRREMSTELAMSRVSDKMSQKFENVFLHQKKVYY
jgi:hypothetical protein